MYSYRVEKGAGIAALTLREEPPPTPGRGQVIVRVRAVSLNFRELMIVENGVYPLPIKANLIPVSDGAGEVVAVGEGVTRVKLGDRVVGQIRGAAEAAP
jgi:NADPH:quinone reductase-like Zn-dependent oxidoreductase